MSQTIVRTVLSSLMLASLLVPAVGFAARNSKDENLTTRSAFSKSQLYNLSTKSRAQDEADGRENKDFEASERTSVMDSDFSYEDRQEFIEDSGGIR